MAISLNVSVPGAIPNLTVLTSSIQDWLDRDDLATKIPTFIQMAEATFNRELRCPEMEHSVVLSVSTEDSLLPEDYLAMRAIYEEGSPDRPLKGTSPTAERFISDGTAETPNYYTLVSGGLRLIPPPSAPVLIHLDYFARIAALSSYNPSNWLLEKHPDAYLYGSLYNAEIYLDNATRASQWKGLTDETLDRINRTSRSDRYGAGPLVPNGAVQVGVVRC